MIINIYYHMTNQNEVLSCNFFQLLPTKTFKFASWSWGSKNNLR